MGTASNKMLYQVVLCYDITRNLPQQMGTDKETYVSFNAFTENITRWVVF